MARWGIARGIRISEESTNQVCNTKQVRGDGNCLIYSFFYAMYSLLNSQYSDIINEQLLFIVSTSSLIKSKFGLSNDACISRIVDLHYRIIKSPHPDVENEKWQRVMQDLSPEIRRVMLQQLDYMGFDQIAKQNVYQQLQGTRYLEIESIQILMRMFGLRTLRIHYKKKWIWITNEYGVIDENISISLVGQHYTPIISVDIDHQLPSSMVCDIANYDLLE